MQRPVAAIGNSFGCSPPDGASVTLSGGRGVAPDMLKDREGLPERSPAPPEGCAGCGGPILDRYHLYVLMMNTVMKYLIPTTALTKVKLKLYFKNIYF